MGKKSKKAAVKKAKADNSPEESVQTVADVATADDADADANSAAESATDETAAPPEAEIANVAADDDPLAQYDTDSLRELYVRAIAEKENIAKRAETEVRKAHDFALSRFAPGICEVCDCLEQAFAQSSGDGGKIHEGVSLTLRKLSAVMENNGILPVRPDSGAAFDADLHQAAGFAPGGENARTVFEVIQCGYTLNGRLIRPAIVRLGNPPAAAERDENAKNDS